MLARYLARRTVHAVLLLFGVSVFSFLLLEMAPGDYFDESRLDPQISREAIAGLRMRYGLTEPLPVRYARWLNSAWEGDFGISMAYNMPVARLLVPRAKNTLLLTITALLLAWAVGIPLGVWSAVQRGRWPDRMIALVASLLLSAPELLMACAVVFLAAQTGSLPAGGMASPGADQMTFARRAMDVARHTILPVTVLAAGMLPLLLRHMHASTAEALDAGFATAARANGISRARLIWRHLLPVAVNPMISLLGLSIGGLMSASLLVEVIMGWPGLGPLFLDAVVARDVHVILGTVMLSACFVIAGSLIADLLLYAVDPRIRVQL